jgi:hypothetical protein
LPYRWLIEPATEIPKVELQAFGLTPKAGCVTQEVSVLHAAGLPPWLADAIEETLPQSVGERHRRLFDFARRLKAIESLASAKVEDLAGYVEEWHKWALPYIGTKDINVTLADFARAWPLIKFVGGPGSIKAAIERAGCNPPPPEAIQFPNPQLQLLVGLCRELQIQRDKRPFYLSCRDAADAIGVTGKQSHVIAHRWLKMLCAVGVLRLEKVGTMAGRRANEYRYLGTF